MDSSVIGTVSTSQCVMFHDQLIAFEADSSSIKFRCYRHRLCSFTSKENYILHCLVVLHTQVVILHATCNRSDMSRAVVQSLLLFYIFTTNGKRILRETESLYEQLANQFDGVDRLPERAFIEDSSGGKIFYSIAIVRRFFSPDLEAFKSTHGKLKC